MNAPFNHRPRRLSDDDLESIARVLRDDQAYRAKVLASCRTTDTGLLLRKLSQSRIGAGIRGWAARLLQPFRNGASPDAVIAVAPGKPFRIDTQAARRIMRGTRPRRMGWAALAAALLFLGPWLVEVALRPLGPTLGNDLVARVEHATECQQTVHLVNDRGETAGLFRGAPGKACGQASFSSRFDDGRALRIAEAIGVLEGGWQAGPLAPFGQDYMRLVIASLSQVELKLRGIKRLDAIALRDQGKKVTFFPLAGSAPILSAFEQLADDAGSIQKARSKMANIRATAIYTVKHLPDDQSRAHFLSSGMIVYKPYGRPGLAGGHAAEVLFGGAPDSLAEVCLFAAASGFFLKQAGPALPDTWNKQAVDRHERAKKRAKACAGQLAASEAERVAALAEIEAFRLPVGGPPKVGKDLSILVQDSLAGRTPPTPGKPVATPLVTDRLSSGRVRVDAALADLAPRLAPGLCIKDCARELHHLIAVAEIEGDALHLRAAFTNRHHMLFGPPPDSDGTLRAPAFGLASLHKVPLTLVAARHGEDRLCNRVQGDIRNAHGPAPEADCGPGLDKGWVATDTALAISMNLPWIDLASRHMAEVSALETALGFLGDGAGPGGAALGTGRRAPPERMMALMAAFDRAAQGEPARTRGLSLLQDGPGAFAVDLPAMGYAPQHAASAAHWLEAPLAKDGTLASLTGAMQAIGCRAVLGKTGSPEIEDSRARARLAVATIACGQRRFVAFAQVDSGRGDMPLGRITAADLSALIAAAIAGTGLHRPRP